MEFELTSEDRDRIIKSIRQKYAEFSRSPEGKFTYPTGRLGMEKLKYDQTIIEELPNDLVNAYCGVGNPFSIGPINEGERVLDIGCGAGIDTFVAAKTVGNRGKVAGIDMTTEMLSYARKNLTKLLSDNVSLQEASAEALPYADETFDVVISNGVFNLIPDKKKAVEEVYRVLKPYGKMMIADQVLIGSLPVNKEERIESWFR